MLRGGIRNWARVVADDSCSLGGGTWRSHEVRPAERSRLGENFSLHARSPCHSGSDSEECCGRRYSLVLSLLSFSRMNASISEALASMRSHCSL